MEFRPGDALLVVDMQNDFCPGGALGVPEGDRIIPELNELMARAARLNIPIFVTRDWHPQNHVSFRDRGGIWPVHCVRETRGAAFHPDLKVPAGAAVISKATHPDKESYSAFGDTDLAERLRALKVRRLWVGGLALDYCVKESALDGQKLGFEIHVLRNLARAVNVKPGDDRLAVVEMSRAGVVIEP